MFKKLLLLLSFYTNFVFCSEKESSQNHINNGRITKPQIEKHSLICGKASHFKKWLEEQRKENKKFERLRTTPIENFNSGNAQPFPPDTQSLALYLLFKK